MGYLPIRRKGGNPYPDGKPFKAVVKWQGGKWYAVKCYEATLSELPDNGVSVGIGRNCGQYAYTTTTEEQGFVCQPDTSLQGARLRRYERKKARQKKGSNRRSKTIWKAPKQKANAQRNANHHASKAIVAKASTVYVEGLKIKSMTASAKGTAEKPGKNVKQKAGLNRAILATGWGQLEQMLGYKAKEAIKVPAAFTSQQCNICGHKVNVDYNASANILASGIGATARWRGGPLETPMIRETDTRRAP